MVESLKFKVWYWKAHLPEKLAFWLAWKLPRWLVYFAAIRMWAEATSGKDYGNTDVTEVRMDECIKRWGNPW